MSELPDFAPDAIESELNREQPARFPRSIHPNVSSTRVLEPAFTQPSEEEHSRVSTASSVGANHGSLPHPNITQVADQRSRSQQTSWTHPNVRDNRPKRYSRIPQATRESQRTRPTRQENQTSPHNPQNFSLTSDSSCSQSSQTYKTCSKFSQSRKSRPKSGGSRVRPKSSRASQKKSLQQLKFQASCDSFNVCDNCKASLPMLGSKSSSYIPKGSQAAAIPATSKSSCMSMDICSDCREAHAVISTESCQSSDFCEYCGASKKPSGYGSSGLPSCDSEGDCSECAGTHRTLPSCQSMAVCSQCRNASQSSSRVNSHPSMNSRSNVQTQSNVKFSSGASHDSAWICDDCKRKCATSHCSSVSVCKNCSKAFTPVPSRLSKPSFGSAGSQQQKNPGNPSVHSMAASRVTNPASCASCGSKLTAVTKPSFAGSKVNFEKPQPDCECQQSDTDLRPKKSDRSLTNKPSKMSQGTQKSASASRFTQTEAADDVSDDFECNSAEFCDDCGGLPDCNDVQFDDDENLEVPLRSSHRSVTNTPERQRSSRPASSGRSKSQNASSSRSKSPVLSAKRSTTPNLPSIKPQNQSATSVLARSQSQVRSTNPCVGLRSDEHPCPSYQRQMSAKLPKRRQQDEPKGENPCASVRENRQASLKDQRKSDKGCKKLDEVTDSCPEPENYVTTGERKLLRMRSKSRDDNEFQCDADACDVVEKARAESENKVLQSSKKRAASMKEKSKKAELDALMLDSLAYDDNQSLPAKPDECPGADNDCGAIERRLKPKKFSKKYQRMRYEIEMQNFTIDKVNRQLQKKIKRGCPQVELQAMKQNLYLEVEKLREMVRFAVHMQRDNQKEIWGPIPISTQNLVDLDDMQAGDDHENAVKPPQKPSRTSQLSGFDDLDDIMYGCEAESLPEPENFEDQKCWKKQLMSCENEIRCENLFPEPPECPKDQTKACVKSRVKSCADDEVEKELKAVTNSMKSLMSNVARMKCKIKTLKSDFHTLKQGKANERQAQELLYKIF